MADWITDGEPGFDIHEMDIDRFEPVQTSRAYVRARGARNYDEVYDLVHPLQPLASPGRCGPRRSTSGSRSWAPSSSRARAGSEPNGSGRIPVTRPPAVGWAAQFWSTAAATEHRATREARGLFDLTSLTKAIVAGPDAEPFLQRIATNDLSGPIGSVVYSAVCDRPAASAATSRSPAGRGSLPAGLQRTAGRRLPATRPARRRASRGREITSGTCAVGIWGPHARAPASSALAE